MLIPPKKFQLCCRCSSLAPGAIRGLTFVPLLMVATSDPQLCHMWLDTLECAQLGVSIASHQTEGPATIVIDAGKGKLRFSQEKLQRFCDLLEEWGDRKGYIRKELESLIGQLNHTCKVFRGGRSFLCHMIDFLHVAHHPPLSRSPTTPHPSRTSLPRTHLFYGCFGVLGLCSLARRHMVPGEMGLSLPVVIHHREGNDQLVFMWFATRITSQSLQTCGPGLASTRE